jgi:hypothetical protein
MVSAATMGQTRAVMPHHVYTARTAATLVPRLMYAVPGVTAVVRELAGDSSSPQADGPTSTAVSAQHERDSVDGWCIARRSLDHAGRPSYPPAPLPTRDRQGPANRRGAVGAAPAVPHQESM